MEIEEMIDNMIKNWTRTNERYSKANRDPKLNLDSEESLTSMFVEHLQKLKQALI